MSDTRSERLTQISESITNMVASLVVQVERGNTIRSVSESARIVGYVEGIASMALPVDGWPTRKAGA